MSVLMLITFMLFMIPHEAVHVFYDHEDTEHTEAHDDEDALSSIHIHCDFLCYYVSDFLASEETRHAELISELPVYYLSPPVESTQRIPTFRESRGPPVL